MKPSKRTSAEVYAGQRPARRWRHFSVRQGITLTLLLFFIDAVHAQTCEPLPRIVISAEEGIFPKSWRNEAIAASALPASPEEAERSLRVIHYALKKYPRRLLNRNVKQVFLVGKLRFSGVDASGTNSRNAIYIANRGNRRGFDDDWIERVVHSEISSILLRNYAQRFPEARWNRINPTTFGYGRGGVDAVRNGHTGRLFDQRFLKAGFVGPYAQSSLENDLNAVAGFAMAGDARLWSAAEQSPRLNAKVELLGAFYHSLDQDLTLNYIRGLESISTQRVALQSPHR